MIRKTASTINDAELDALYDQLERVQRVADILRTANAPDGSPSPLRPAASPASTRCSSTCTCCWSS